MKLCDETDEWFYEGRNELHQTSAASRILTRDGVEKNGVDLTDVWLEGEKEGRKRVALQRTSDYA